MRFTDRFWSCFHVGNVRSVACSAIISEIRSGEDSRIRMERILVIWEKVGNGEKSRDYGENRSYDTGYQLGLPPRDALIGPIPIIQTQWNTS
jgi:hypothetical protein